MVIDPSLADSSIPLQFTKNDEKEETYDPEFEEWFGKFSKLDEPDQKKMLLDLLRSKVSEEDAEMIDLMISVIQNNEDKNTDILFITSELKKKNPNVNEFAVLQYYMLLNTVGIISVFKND